MSIYPTQTQLQTFGTLQVTVRSGLNNLPIENATVNIYNINDMKTKLHELKTDQTGNTAVIHLPAPPLEYSFEPTGNLPYSNYIITVEYPDFQSVQIIRTQICEREDYPKESYLHRFVEFLVERILFEQKQVYGCGY